MILTCPACGTQYVVKDGAIPEGGRKVRCASCRHSWHQDAPPLELDEAVGVDLQTGGDDIAAAAAPPDFSAHAGPADESYPEERGTDYGTDAEGDVPDDERTAGDADQDAVADDDYGDDDRLQSDDGTVMDPEPPRVSAESEQFAIAAPVDDEFSPFAAREPAERKSRGPLVAMLLLFVLVAAVAALFWFLAPPEWKARVGLAEASGTPLQLMLTARDRQA
ncbi:MAG TPA: zinc-ribbon domain-containing protein, partial [Sphingomicrobium sp.]